MEPTSAEVEPGPAASPGGGTGGRSGVLLRTLGGAMGIAVPVDGLGAGGNDNGSEDGGGCGARGARVVVLSVAYVSRESLTVGCGKLVN